MAKKVIILLLVVVVLLATFHKPMPADARPIHPADLEADGNGYISYGGTSNNKPPVNAKSGPPYSRDCRGAYRCRKEGYAPPPP